MLGADGAPSGFVKVVQRVPVRVRWAPSPPADVILRNGLSAEVTIEVDR
jgi:multidrug resistance efflux pump